MTLIKILAAIFLLPGNLVLSGLNVSVEEDSGMLRSMVNMLFWGFIAVVIALPIIF